MTCRKLVDKANLLQYWNATTLFQVGIQSIYWTTSRRNLEKYRWFRIHQILIDHKSEIVFQIFRFRRPFYLRWLIKEHARFGRWSRCRTMHVHKHVSCQPSTSSMVLRYVLCIWWLQFRWLGPLWQHRRRKGLGGGVTNLRLICSWQLSLLRT